MKKMILIVIAGLAAGYSWRALVHRVRSVPPPQTVRAAAVNPEPVITLMKSSVTKPTVKINASIQTQTAMQALVKSQVQQMSATDLDTAQVQSDLQKQADNFTIKDLQNLESLLLSKESTQDERSVSLYLLSLSGVRALPALTHFSATALPEFSHLQDPHSADSSNKNFEVSLRIAALEAIDRQTSLQNEKTQVQASLQQILKTQNDPTLKMLVEVSLAGVRSGKPGKLSRFIQAMVNE